MGLKPPPLQILSACYYVYKQFAAKGHPNQLSGYKQCYTYKNQSLEVSKIWLSLRATNWILEAKPPPPHFSKVVYAPEEEP